MRLPARNARRGSAVGALDFRNHAALAQGADNATEMFEVHHFQIDHDVTEVRRDCVKSDIVDIRASVADALVELVDELPRVGRISFRRLTSGLVERLEVIVRFLALLELFKQGYVELEQPERFGDVEIVWTGGDGSGDEADTRLPINATDFADEYEG
jgi:hypothetical protein